MKKNIAVILLSIVFTPLVLGQSLAEGIDAYNLKQDRKAKQIFRQVLKRNNKSEVARFNLASIYLYEKKYQIALKHYTVVANSASKLKLAALYFMAECCYYLKEDQKAEQILKKLKLLKLPKSLKNNVNELYADLKLESKAKAKIIQDNDNDQYALWGAAELGLGYSDNLNLDSELDTTKAGGVEFDGDFLLGLDIYASDTTTVTPSINYYFSKEQKTGGYNSSGTIAQLRYKNKYHKKKALILKGSLESINTYDNPYLSKTNLQIGQVHTEPKYRMSYYYKYQAISEEVISANYLAGSAHYFSTSYSYYTNSMETYLGLAYTSKNLNDSVSIASSYSGIRPSLSVSFKGKNNKKFKIGVGLNIKSYSKKDAGEKEKRKDTLLSLSVESTKKIGSHVELVAGYGFTNNSSNYKSLSNNKEYSVNSLKAGISIEF